jgi:hypothetical protein
MQPIGHDPRYHVTSIARILAQESPCQQGEDEERKRKEEAKKRNKGKKNRWTY